MRSPRSRAIAEETMSTTLLERVAKSEILGSEPFFSRLHQPLERCPAGCRSGAQAVPVHTKATQRAPAQQEWTPVRLQHSLTESGGAANGTPPDQKGVSVQ